METQRRRPVQAPAFRLFSRALPHAAVVPWPAAAATTSRRRHRAPCWSCIPAAAMACRFRAFAGEIRALEESPLSFRVGGQLVKRFVDAGDRVHRGEVLAELDARDLRAQADAAQAQGAAAEAELARASTERQRLARSSRTNSSASRAYDAEDAAYKSAAGASPCGARAARRRAQPGGVHATARAARRRDRHAHGRSGSDRHIGPGDLHPRRRHGTRSRDRTAGIARPRLPRRATRAHRTVEPAGRTPAGPHPRNRRRRRSAGAHLRKRASRSIHACCRAWNSDKARACSSPSAVDGERRRCGSPVRLAAGCRRADRGVGRRSGKAHAAPDARAHRPVWRGFGAGAVGRARQRLDCLGRRHLLREGQSVAPVDRDNRPVAGTSPRPSHADA
jgi:multidrug efflux system membrane fusion protein